MLANGIIRRLNVYDVFSTIMNRNLSIRFERLTVFTLVALSQEGGLQEIVRRTTQDCEYIFLLEAFQDASFRGKLHGASNNSNRSNLISIIGRVAKTAI